MTLYKYILPFIFFNYVYLKPIRSGKTSSEPLTSVTTTVSSEPLTSVTTTVTTGTVVKSDTALDKILRLPDSSDKNAIIKALFADLEKAHSRTLKNIQRELQEQLAEKESIIRNETRIIAQITCEMKILESKLGINLVRGEIEVVEEDYGPKLLNKTGQETFLSDREVRWRRMLNYRYKKGDLRLIADEIKKSGMGVNKFAATVARFYKDLSDKIHLMLKNPDLDFLAIKTHLQKKYHGVLYIIHKAYESSTVTIRWKSK